jgi:dTDP-4-dehydrorhamnose reductase
VGSVLRALVVGSDSAIGARICEATGAAGTTRRSPPGDRIPFDLIFPEDLPPAAVTYFCGAINGFKTCAADPEMARRVNVQGTVMAARGQVGKGGKVVLLSSCAAETHPDTVYGRLKLEAEQEFLKMGDAASIFRFATVLFAGETAYPNRDYNPIEAGKLVAALTAPFAPGLHRLLNQ